MQDLFPFFIYSLDPICERITDECVGGLYWFQRFFFFFLFYSCQVDASRLLLGLSLLVVSGEFVNKKLVNTSLLIFWRGLFSRRFLAVGSFCFLRDEDPWWFLISYHLVVMYIQFVELQGCSGRTGCYIIAAFLHSCVVFLQTLEKWKIIFSSLPSLFLITGRFFFIYIYVWD